MQKGEYQWTTPPEKGQEIFVTRLYLDGDMLCWFLNDESKKSYSISPDILDSHLRKIDNDLKSVSLLSKHLSLLAGLLITLLTFAMNPAGWVENLIILGGIGVAGYIGRKFTAKMAFKILGVIAGKFFNKNRPGTK